MIKLDKCPVCNNSNFKFSEVLSRELINDWKLSLKEALYINYQQGFHCDKCLANLRSMTLAQHVTSFFNTSLDFKSFMLDFKQSILEINQAGSLSIFLKTAKRHTLQEYPEIDIENIKYDDESFDMIIHSDTLEHIPNSVRALSECKRVLKRSGVMFFTIPIIHERLTIKRHGMPKSYHGVYSNSSDDLTVYTEYGSNFYMELLAAGFKDIRLYSLVDESSLSIAAIKK